MHERKNHKGNIIMKKGAVLYLRILCLLCNVILCMTLDPATVFAAERDTIRVGFFAFDGYHEIDDNGVRSGYGYDFLRLISRYWNVEFEYVGYENSWSDMMDMLERGEIDMVTSAQATPERMEKFELSQAIGSSSAMLTTRVDNTAIRIHDYSTYDGIRIGMLRDSSRNEDLVSYAKENGFSYIPVYFERHDELEAALQSGEVDAALTSTLRKTSNEQVLDAFATQNFHVLVRKGDTELLAKINYAIDQLNATEGDWQNDLNSKYYTRSQERSIFFTDAEKEIIRQYANGEKTLVVSVSPDKEPYAYAENGEPKGILFDYFDLLAEYAGIPYTVLLPEDRDDYQRLWENGEINLCLDGRFENSSQAEDMKVTPTAPYATMRLAMVTRRDFDGIIDKIAVTNVSGPFSIESGLAPDAERIYVDDREKGLQAVLDGEVDATFVYLYTAQQFVNKDTHGQLTYTLVNSISIPYSLSICENAPYELAGIFTKCIYAIPEDTLETIAADYTSYQASDLDLWTWIQLYPFTAILLLGIIFTSIILVIILFQRHKSAKIAKERAALYQELAAQSERVSSAKSRFLANVSHDIRTPMNAIMGISTLMDNESDLTEQMRGYVRKLRLCSQYLLGLLSDILDMSRIEVKEIELNRESFCIMEQIELVDNIIRLQAIERKQQFEIQMKTLCHNDLLGDAVRLRQVLQNLLSNAVKYTPKGGKITLEVEELCEEKNETATFRFTVTDNGIGMTKEFLEHVFEPFVRNEDSVVNKIQGTGLGLAITKNIVDLMGGDIQITSEPEKGTTVILTLCMEIDQEAYCPADPILKDTQLLEEEETPYLQGKRFLCAEDNELNAEILEALLETKGASCVIYPDGAKLVEAFETVDPGEYAAILMDVQMPNMNGLEATKAIRAGKNPLGKTIPIIAMTANAFTEDVQRSLNAGMDAHISKPIDIESIERIMRKFSGGGHLSAIRIHKSTLK